MQNPTFSPESKQLLSQINQRKWPVNNEKETIGLRHSDTLYSAGQTPENTTEHSAVRGTLITKVNRDFIKLSGPTGSTHINLHTGISHDTIHFANEDPSVEAESVHVAIHSRTSYSIYEDENAYHQAQCIFYPVKYDTDTNSYQTTEQTNVYVFNSNNLSSFYVLYGFGDFDIVSKTDQMYTIEELKTLKKKQQKYIQNKLSKLHRTELNVEVNLRTKTDKFTKELSSANLSYIISPQKGIFDASEIQSIIVFLAKNDIIITSVTENGTKITAKTNYQV